jgi:hypothetical protein
VRILEEEEGSKAFLDDLFVLMGVQIMSNMDLFCSPMFSCSKTEVNRVMKRSMFRGVQNLVFFFVLKG